MTFYIKRYFGALLISTFLIILSFSDRVMAAEFFETLYDVPVLLDLEEVSEEALVFDKPSGRIAYAVAVSFSNRGDILTAYQAALNQMGWKKKSVTQYIREGEVLTISVIKSDTSDNGGVSVDFSLKPVEE